MIVVVSCKDLEKQEIFRTEDEDVNSLSSAADDTSVEKSDASDEQATTIRSKDDFDRFREWVHVQLESYLNLPSVFAINIALAAMIGTVIAVNKHNWYDNPAAHPYARLWGMSFEESTFMTGFSLIIVSSGALGLRMRAEGRRKCNKQDVRIFAQDLFIALVLAIPFSLLNTFVNWVHPSGI